MQVKLKVSGMTCEMCEKHVQNALQNVAGVQQAEVDLHAGAATVEHVDASVDAMIEAVQEEGYEAKLL